MRFEFFPTDGQGRKVRVFSLTDTFLDEYRGQQPDWGAVGYLTYKRTYARTKPDGTSENWWETCRRVVEGVYNIQKIHCRKFSLPWDEPKARKSAEEMYGRMFYMKWLPPGRGLWTMGTDLVYTKGSACLNNCAFVSTKDIDTDFAAPFTFLMDMSMLGVGVGGDCKGADKVKIQTPRRTDEPYIVGDSREGWVEVMRTVLNSFVGKGYYPSVIDWSQVRPAGSPIKGFGGTASGPGPLKDLVGSVTKLLMPKGDQPYKITSTHIVDIFNMIGRCVVAGGVRRTAEIMFGDPDDAKFLALKDPTKLNKWRAELGNLEAKGKEDSKEAKRLRKKIEEHPLRTHRWASNNSVFGEIGMDYTQMADSIAANGEPGVIYLDTMRGYGRLVDPRNDKDMRVMGSNPCSEQSLESFELCCLVETFPAHHEDIEDYKRTLKFAYLYAKTVTLVPTHDPKTNAVMMRNKRIGCSQSGIVQAMNKLGRREYLRWCDEGYGFIQDLDTIYSEWLCVPASKKTTSVKPSGTVSLLCGATPGIHYPHSEYYIRRIRIQEGSPLVESCRRAGYPVEKDVYSPRTMVVSFPIHEEHFTKGKDDVTIWEQFANAADLQRWWADNQVSITVTFKESEASSIKTCLEVFEDRLKSVSLLPLSAHGYAQAPYETITKDQYDEMSCGIEELDLSNAQNEVIERFCDGDKCELRPEKSTS
jgi:ribonucleoside-triphosphate reductase